MASSNQLGWVCSLLMNGITLSFWKPLLHPLPYSVLVRLGVGGLLMLQVRKLRPRASAVSLDAEPRPRQAGVTVLCSFTLCLSPQCSAILARAHGGRAAVVISVAEMGPHGA